MGRVIGVCVAEGVSILCKVHLTVGGIRQMVLLELCLELSNRKLLRFKRALLCVELCLVGMVARRGRAVRRATTVRTVRAVTLIAASPSRATIVLLLVVCWYVAVVVVLVLAVEMLVSWI